MEHKVLWLAPILGIATAAIADAPAATPLDVVSVVTAGYWVDSGDRGTYRVVIRSAGFEHVSSLAVAEWIAEPKGRSGDARLTHSRTLVPYGFFSLGAPRVDRRGSNLHVQLDGILTHDPNQVMRCEFDLRPDGVVVVVRQCSTDGI